MEFETFCQEDTKTIAYGLAQNAKKGEIYCLTGELGTGKTHFSKGFAKGLLIDDEITSPTFTIINEYKGEIDFFHFDVYRIKSEDEMFDIGYEEYFFGNGICIIEWAELIPNLIPKNAIWIDISKNLEKGENYRLIKVKYK